MTASYEVFIKRRGRTAIGHSKDISPHGIGLYTDEELPAGETVELSIVPPEGMLNVELVGEVRHCRPNPDRTDPPHRFQVGIEFSAETKESIPFLEIQGKLVKFSAAHSVSIEADAETCYRLLAEFERYPEWVSVMENAKSLDRYPDGRSRRVEFLANVYFRKVRTLLDYSYDDRNYCLSWVSAGGDFLSVTGRYYFKPQGPARCGATYELTMCLDFPVPNRVMSYFSRIVMRRSMRDFKRFVEQQARAKKA